MQSNGSSICTCLCQSQLRSVTWVDDWDPGNLIHIPIELFRGTVFNLCVKFDKVCHRYEIRLFLC